MIFCLLLALATIALYNSVTRAPFLNFDDQVYVTDNPQVRAGLTWNTVVWAFRTPKAFDWHPITWLSYALDWQIFGLDPAGYHTINVLLHAANAVLLFLLLEGATGLAWRSLAVAALFALHPINVESVAWISERKTVLSMLFFLLALAAYGWYTRRPGVGRYLVVTLAYVLGLMSKAQVITFPFALLLLDYWPLGRLAPHPARPHEVGGEPAVAAAGPSFWKLIGEKVPWFALSAASAVITIKTGGAAFNYMVLTDATRSKLSLGLRLGNAALSYVKYLGKAFWPVNLAIVYPHLGPGISILGAVLSAFAIGAVSILALIFRRRRPFLVGWFWFLGTLVPMIGLVDIGVHAMADRYAYIPLLGIFVIVSWGAADLIKRWHVPTAVAAAGTVAILLALGIALHRQVSFWSDNVTLWTHTLEITEANFTAEDNLAGALITQGRVEEALPHLLRARALRPDDPQSALNVATYLQMHGKYQAALDGYARVVQLTKAPPFLATARANSGYAHLSLKQYGDAQLDFEAALKEQPGNSSAYRGLGLLAQRAGDIAQATKDYERSAKLQPSPVGYLLLAQALEIGGQAEAARAAQSQAARMDRDLNDDIAVVRQLLAN
ncbi:MAG TPA: tetratricopeptide repeat protein [Terriglobales bacterium]|nr:tetratricopeptide repeat protein [Terriglobales bacterium]